jgi:diguanylate cyclase (GGDEF)-like protein/PAS domain S-box-containing protein
MMLHGSHDYRLVALSIALAMVAAYTALDLAGRVTAAHQRSRWVWLAGGATAMGLGIWSMHYIGMLAFSLPVPVLYQYPTVGSSLLAAIAASAVALFTVSRERMGVGSCIAGGLAMGGGIAAMHYIGMAAMRLPAMMQYNWPIVAFSVAAAAAVSLIALVLAFRHRQEKKGSRRKLVSALIMGSAIPLMHYTAMAAVEFYRSDVPFSARYTLQISFLGVVVISVTSFLVMMLAIMTSFLDRMLALHAAVVTAARDGEAHFRILAEAIPQIVWTAVPEGGFDYCNQRWYDLTGLSEPQTLGWGWADGLHPDDRPVALQSWEKAQSAGEPFEMEYRLRKAAGGYRWHLVRATPMRDSSGAIAKWFGACTDIDDQMHHQRVLEEQIKQHTAALVQSNTRLQSEMTERILTQQELNQQNARMVEELTIRSKRATNLAKMAELLQSCPDSKDAFSVVAGMAPKVFPELRCAVLLFDAAHERLEVVPIGDNSVLPVIGFSPQDCWALRTGHVHIVVAGNQIAQCAHAASCQYSYCCLPLQAHGEVLGILHLQMIEPGELSQPVVALATMFAEQAGLSVANIRLREALRDQSIRDPLTGLYNRRYMEEMLERETLRAVRADQGLGVLMLDLDHFKSFNDTYGHDAGDTVLREAAAFLLKSVRAEDIVCRFGGEEFIVILPVADLKVTQARAERIRSRLRELPVLHQGQSLGMVTVSVGVAELPQHGTSRKELIEAADAALYRAKREGRDRVVVAAAPATETVPAAEVAALGSPR